MRHHLGTAMAAYLLPISDREPLMWILRERKTAFPSYRRSDAERLAPGDLMLLYTTRGCFHNPPRDRGRVIGVATAKRAAERLNMPIRFGERDFPIGVDLQLHSLVPRDDGIELAPMVASLPRTFPNPQAWSATMRRALVPFDADEAALIVGQFAGRRVTKQSVESYA